MAGRPTDYTPELAAAILEMTSQGVPMKEVAAADGMPHLRTIRSWLVKDEQFRHLYLEAKQIAMIWLSEEITEIADDSSQDVHVTTYGDGVERISPNTEFIGRSKIRIDARKWNMARLAPKIFGEKIEQTLQGPNGSPLTVSWKKAE